MLEDMSMPWPQCLGKFDEESCRYFLHEIGKRIVPSYPFSFGMEEVYGLILDRYGYEGTPDVTSLLQELLEDDHSATGLGDDGDVWRSWRHGWRHRNDDSRNPFIPRYGALVLRQSTLPRLRFLKANNFIRLYEQQNFDPGMEYWKNRQETIRPALGESRETCIAASVSAAKDDRDRLHESAIPQIWPVDSITNSAQPQFHCAGTTDSSASVQRVRRSSATTLDTGLLLPLGLFNCSRRGIAQLRGGNASHGVILKGKHCQLPTTLDSETRPERWGLYSSPVHATAEISMGGEGLPCRDRLETSQDGTSLEAEDVNYSKHCECHYPCSEDESGCEVSGSGAISGVVPATAGQHRNEQHLAANLEFKEHKQRAVHRQARLIDGTIFTSRTRRCRTIGSAQVKVPTILGTSSRRTSGHFSWSPVHQRDSLRANITHEIGRLLGRDKKDKLNNPGVSHQSVPGLCRLSTSRDLSTLSMATDKCQQIPPKPRTTRPFRNNFGLDGISDGPPETNPFVDLNKPLPLSPEEIVRSMSYRSQQTLSQYSDITSNLPSTASTTSSVSKTSSRRDFRDLATGLLQAGMLASHELPPIHEVDANSRDSVDPPKSPFPSASPVSYTSLARGNPFIEKNTYRSPTKPPPLNFNNSRKEEDKKYNKGFKTSPNTECCVVTPAGKQSNIPFPPVPWYKSSSDGQHDAVTPRSRGRTMLSPDSPRNRQQENMLLNTPTKRSRSPIKKLLGLTKSSSTNKLEDIDPPPRPKTPGSTAKESLKKWGDRFRYGFLTPDQEQLRQEELIEAHNNDSATSTPQNSTFPISLPPPVQAKIQSEIELIMTVTANRYLMRESRAGRISAESVAKTKELWERLNRPQVVEFHYDQLTQHHLVMVNLDRVKLYGDASKDPITINAVMRGWKTLAHEMSIRTFCSPDSVIRKHLHDAHRVLELLGAPLVTFLAYEDMQLKTLTTINQRQKERMDRRAGSADSRNINSSSAMNMMMASHRRNASEGSCQFQGYDYTDYPITSLQMDKISLSPTPTPLSGSKVRKATGAEGVIMSLPPNFERSRDEYASRSRGANMGLTIKEI